MCIGYLEMSDTVNEDTEMWKAYRKVGQEKRASNRESCKDILDAKGVMYERKNEGAHLIVSGKLGKIDYWPGTGKFIARNGKQGRGIVNLLKLCETTNG